MAFQLNPLAVLNADLLRAIAADPIAAASAYAATIGKDPSNTRRALGSLAEAGLIREGGGERLLTADAADQLNALDRAQNPASGLGVTEAYHDDLVPDPDQPRKDFTSAKAIADLEELRDSLIARGRILQPIVVRALADEPGRFLITDGERRWRAAGMAMETGDWPRTQLLPITIQETDGKETKLSQLTANMVRADMTPLEECEAFADLIDNHAMTTAEIAREIGKTQKLVQNRLRLRHLSDADRARMALPEDHDDHLGYKAALKSLMTPREPGSSDTDALVIPAQAEMPAAPAETSEAFEATLHDREALILIEVADKAERHPDPDLGSEHYTTCQGVGSQGMASPLIARGLLGFRQRGPAAFVRPRLFSSPYGQWLEAIGFHADRAALLFERRARVHGEAVALKLAEDGLYATGWLNPAGDPPAHPNGAAPSASGLGAALAREQVEHDDQPALIEETAEERQARQGVEREREAEARARNAADLYARQVGDWMAFARASGASDYLNPFIAEDGLKPALTPEQMAVALITAVVTGKVGEAGALLATLQMRVGAMGSSRTLEQMPEGLIHQVVTEARA